jgi:metal-dependent hydrolase (beta-lactamase superfamily II)
VEVGNDRILFDTGAGDVALKNADTMGWILAASTKFCLAMPMPIIPAA